ncbi:MAG: hypothetical protein H0V29_13235 [Thermoleophilaceae bacterium]|nr:hypothetical protein [Thermoleophilaceae bacterium]
MPQAISNAQDIELEEASDQAFCPHCFLLVEAGVEQPWPPAPTRCRHCRLLIGPGRGRQSADANPGARGTAAGVFAHRAKHSEAGEEASPDRVREAIRSVAERRGARPERLLMVDYQQTALEDESLPPLGDVFTAFGSWKRARKEAAVG